MYTLSQHLIQRADEQTFFDSFSFRIFKCNEKSYEILNSLQGISFNQKKFENICTNFGVTTKHAQKFLQKCLDNELIVSNEIQVDN